MQSHLAIRADVHGRTQADGFHALEDFNVVGGVLTVATIAGNFFSFCTFLRRCHCRLFRRHQTPFVRKNFRQKSSSPRVPAAEFPVKFKVLILQSLRGELSTTDYSTSSLSAGPRKRVI